MAHISKLKHPWPAADGSGSQASLWMFYQGLCLKGSCGSHPLGRKRWTPSWQHHCATLSHFWAAPGPAGASRGKGQSRQAVYSPPQHRACRAWPLHVLCLLVFLSPWQGKEYFLLQTLCWGNFTLARHKPTIRKDKMDALQLHPRSYNGLYTWGQRKLKDLGNCPKTPGQVKLALNSVSVCAQGQPIVYTAVLLFPKKRHNVKHIVFL